MTVKIPSRGNCTCRVRHKGAEGGQVSGIKGTMGREVCVEPGERWTIGIEARRKRVRWH